MTHSVIAGMVRANDHVRSMPPTAAAGDFPITVEFAFPTYFTVATATVLNWCDDDLKCKRPPNRRPQETVAMIEQLSGGRRSFQERPTFALCATAGNLRLHEWRLVDAGRIELPTSALRTQRSPS